MAFKHTPSDLRKCATCPTEQKFFKMFQSFREEDRWTDANGKVMAKVVCADCELRKRHEEGNKWGDQEKEIVGSDYPTMYKVRKDLKDNSKRSWSDRSDVIINAKAALVALKDKVLEEQRPQVNYAACLDMMATDQDKDSMDQPSMSSTALAVPTAEHSGSDGSGGGGSSEVAGVGSGAEHSGQTLAKRQRLDPATLPLGRTDEVFKEIWTNVKLSAKQLRQVAIQKSRTMARAMMGIMTNQDTTLGAFAAAGKRCLSS